MQEILSQGEIDALLDALNTGDIPIEEIDTKTGQEIKIKSYDFRRPNKFSKEHLRTLEILHNLFARHVTSFLSGYLRSNVNIELVSVSQTIFDEFIRSIPTPTVLTIFDLLPLNGSVILEANNAFIFPVIDLMFGGNGSTGDLNRELTDIEIQVTKKIMTKILEYFIPTWQDIFEVKPELYSVETNPRLQQLYSPNEVVALLTFTVSLGENIQGMINLCYPYITLDPVIAKLSMRQQFIRNFSSSHEDDYANILHWLNHCNIDITAVLGDTQITVNDLLQIQQGDVIVLDQNINSDINVLVGENLKFGAQVGLVDENLAIQIVSLIEGEFNND
ncbi:flagellar motor switch protein FliM [Desulfoscipio gibsoniae]|uniref:Flagellar motor switch protein FliM n=1 Tax=Desulfoscipio gibsoniae DSM 7213 TaxID=767817 RepID=R4KPP8_9FIRM|nr:flagellar motor switch protein FliM [Desulfoscipio gibsoniae]AGL01631.1 flagellar motor switch protein FliM [Desulfoscipio gibsoniae DSM 7213]